MTKLTCVEYERLQTLPDGYTKAVKNSERYKMVGNAWTVDVIAHIFKSLKYEETPIHYVQEVRQPFVREDQIELFN